MKTKIESVNLHQSRCGVEAVVVVDARAWAIRFAPGSVVTEAQVRASWRENRHNFMPWNGI